MKRLRTEEIWAKECIARELGVHVEPHDDGTRPGMHDLWIRYPNREPGAAEVTAAADAASIELWNLVNGKGRWHERGLRGGWSVEIMPTARANQLLSDLPKLLSRLEGLGITNLDADRWRHGPLEQEISELRIRRLGQLGTDFPGSIYVTFGSQASFLPDSGDALPEWIGPWLCDPAQADNLVKLSASGAKERHLFVFLPGFSAAPFVVEELFMRNAPYLPDSAPLLPSEITHLWVMSSWNDGKGQRWAPDTDWKIFEKVGHEPSGGAT